MIEGRQPRIDPELRSQLRDAGEHERIEAILTLKRLDARAEPPPPTEVEEAVEGLLRRVAEETRSFDYEFNVFGFLDSFAVAAEPRFLERLLSQSEIVSASANRASGSGGRSAAP